MRKVPKMEKKSQVEETAFSADRVLRILFPSSKLETFSSNGALGMPR
jgi:hypothetical protein